MFRVFRGEQNPGTVPSCQPRIQPQNTPNTRKRAPSFSVVSVFSVVSKPQGLSPVTSQESNHRTRRTHGNQGFLFPCVPCVPCVPGLNKNQGRFTASGPEVILLHSYAISSEDSRMVRNLIRNQAPGNRLRVRIPCPPLQKPCFSHTETARLRDPWDFCGLGAIRY